MATAEQRARANIDKLLEQAGWSVQDVKAAGVIEAKKQGVTLTGVEAQSTRYARARVSKTFQVPSCIESSLRRYGHERSRDQTDDRFQGSLQDPD
jgi:type I site-specific restriction endonuclease